MGEIIAVFVISVFFFLIFKLFRVKYDISKFKHGYGTIDSKDSEAEGTCFYINFKDEYGNDKWGKSIKYVGARKKYEIGEEVEFYYQLYGNGDNLPMKSTFDKVVESIPVRLRKIDALIIFKNPKTISCSEKQAKYAWIWLLASAAFVVLDIVLIVQRIV